MTHELKSALPFFKATWRGFKPFEIRKNDRKFEVMDEVILKEWDQEAEEYTGREVRGWINYISHYQQDEGYVVFSFEELQRTED
jgi:hypothetical protein